MLNKEELINIKDNKEFWKKTCEYFIREGDGKTGAMVQGCVKNIDFSNENVFKLTKLLGNNGPKITPVYFSKICGTSGLIIFLIKDALDYAGILIDKKTSQARLHKNYTYTSEVLKFRIERLKNIQQKFFS
jgi:hypothetical protein